MNWKLDEKRWLLLRPKMSATLSKRLNWISGWECSALVIDFIWPLVSAKFVFDLEKKNCEKSEIVKHIMLSKIIVCINNGLQSNA